MKMTTLTVTSEGTRPFPGPILFQPPVATSHRCGRSREAQEGRRTDWQDAAPAQDQHKTADTVTISRPLREKPAQMTSFHDTFVAWWTAGRFPSTS